MSVPPAGGEGPASTIEGRSHYRTRVLLNQWDNGEKAGECDDMLCLNTVSSEPLPR